MTLKSIKDRVIVKKNKLVDEKQNGIIILSCLQEGPASGVITSVGDQVFNKEISVGASILFEEMAGFEIEEGGEILIIIREENILAIVKD